MAQDLNHHVEAGYGTSLKAGLIKTLLNQKQDIITEGTSVYLFGYEYRFKQAFALSVGYTTQKISGSYC